MSEPVVGKYSFYDGLEWKVFYPRTRYDQVIIDSTTRFLRPSTHTVNGKSFYNNGDVGIEIYPADIKMSANDNTTLANYLQNIPNVVTANNVITNGNIPVGNGSKGLVDSGISLQSLKEMAEGKTRAYVTDAIQYNSKYYIMGGSTKLEVGTAIVMDDVDYSSQYENTVAFSLALVGNGYTIGEIGNSVLTYVQGSYVYLVKERTWNNHIVYVVEESIKYLGDNASVHIGDALYITNIALPDYWVKSINDNPNIQSITFYQLETQKVDLTPYVEKGTPVYVYNGQDIAYDPEGSDFTPTDDYSHLGSSDLILRKKYTGNSISSAKVFNDVIASIDANGVEVYWKSSLYDTAHSANSMNSPIVNYYNFFDPTFAEKYDTYALLSYLSTTPQRFANIDDIKNLKGYIDNQAIATYLKGASVSGNTLTLTKQDDTTLSFTGTKVFYGATTPTNANEGDLWVDTSS